ncbi:MAG: ABC transporter ATP-binding protein [Fimbriimonadaceae bacterium]|nr:ABC transporter ATP-binding protein [Fimbriimonadaceae bacterium]
MPPALAELRGAGKTYHSPAGTVAALQPLDWTLSDGEFVVVTGRSGSGKSTLLALCGALATPTAGSVRLFGEALEALNDAARSVLRATRLGFVFQFTGLLPTLTVFDNVRLGTLFRPPEGVAADLRARELLQRVGLGDRLGAYPAELSGGEQRRVAIARALLGQPALLLADEPTGDLDNETEAGIMALFGELHAEGLTVVLVTHNLDLRRYATRWLRLQDGRIAEEGQP